MFMWKTAAVFAIALATSVGPVAAQIPCTLGVYADDAATSSVLSPVENSTFDVYVVLSAESLASAASYSLIAERLGTDYFVVGAAYGPDGDGFSIEFNGENVALGVCIPGFNGFPVVVAKYTMMQVNPSAAPSSIGVGGGNEDPDFPVFSTCSGDLIPCSIGPVLTVDEVVSTESESFGAVKSLFRS